MPRPRPTMSPFEAFPQLDTGTHHGRIQALAATRDGRTLVSAGETTLRVWNLPERRLERLLLGRVHGTTDDGAEGGKVLSMALSPDGRWAAVVKPWWRGPARRRAPARRAAGGHAATDGGFAATLAAALAADRALDAGLADDGGWIAELQIFELATGNLRSRMAFPGKLLDVDFSPDGRWLALGANRPLAGRARGQRRAELLVYELRRLLQAGCRSAVGPEPAARLCVGPAFGCDTLPVRLCFVPAAASVRQEPQALVAVVSDEASRCGHLFWLRHSAAQGLAVAEELRTDVPLSVESLAASATMAAVATLPPARTRGARGRLLWFRHDHGGAGAIDTEAPAVSLVFSPSGARLAAGLRADPLEGGAEPPHGSQTVQVSVYDVSPATGPALRSSHFGHDASVHGLAFVDEDTVASAGGDSQAIHLWRAGPRVAELDWAFRGVGRTMVMPGITADERVLFGTVPPRLLPPGHAIRQQSFDLRRLCLSPAVPTRVRRGDQCTRKWLVGDVDDVVLPLWFVGDLDGPQADLPQRPQDLTLFVGSDGQWVIWTASGYYACSGPEAAARIGYRINRGLAQEAQLVPSDRFKDFYRPDIVRAVVRHGTEARARVAGQAIAPVDVVHALPPIVERLPDGRTRREGGGVHLRFSVESASPEALPTRLSLLRNGRVVWVDRSPPQRQRLRCEVPAPPLVPGVNRFAFHAENVRAKSVPVAFELAGPPMPAAADGSPDPAAQAPGLLYLLAVGVGQFADARNTPLQLAAGDAKAMHDAFAHGHIARDGRGRAARRHGAGGNHAFAAVDARLLVDAQATKAAILAELDRMAESIRARHRASGTERDVLFVFFSGHGMRVGSRQNPQAPPTLFFVNHDLVVSADEVDATGLSILDLGDRVTSVPAEVVLVFDACHSALAGSEVMQGLDAAELAQRVHALYERGMYLVSAARAEELASGSTAIGAGVLTASVLEAVRALRPLLRGGRRAPGVEVLMTELMAGVQRLLPQVSARAGTDPQTPVCRVYGDLMPLTILKTGTPER